MKIQEIKEMEPFNFFKWLFSNEGLSKDKDVKSMMYRFMKYLSSTEYIMIDESTMSFEVKHIQQLEDGFTTHVSTKSYIDFLIKSCNKERLLFFDRISKITGLSVEGKTHYYKQIYKQMIECRTILDGHIDVLGYDFLDSFLDDLVGEFKENYTLSIQNIDFDEGDEEAKLLSEIDLSSVNERVAFLNKLGVLDYVKNKYSHRSELLGELIFKIMNGECKKETVNRSLRALKSGVTDKNYPKLSTKLSLFMKQLDDKNV